LEVVALACELPERLPASLWANRDHQPPAVFELLDERLRQMIGRSGDEDGVVRRMLFPTKVSVTLLNLDSILEPLQSCRV